jgi:hypothetical protein
MNSREVMNALGENRAPDMDHIEFRDEENDTETVLLPGSKESTANLITQVSSLDLSDPESDSTTEIHNPDITLSSPSPAPASTTAIKCRKCRRLLAKSAFILPHKPPSHRDPASNQEPCAHIFLHPLSWMRPTLSQGELDGRLSCPKCSSHVGKYGWQGLRCSCGGWVTPGFGLARGKVDEVQEQGSGLASRSGTSQGQGSTASSSALLQHGIRLPPGMKRGGNGNL